MSLCDVPWYALSLGVECGMRFHLYQPQLLPAIRRVRVGIKRRKLKPVPHNCVQ